MRGQGDLRVIVGMVLAIMIILIVGLLIYRNAQKAGEIPDNYQSCGTAGGLVGVKGECFSERQCTDEAGTYPQGEAGGYWQYLGKFGCPIEDDAEKTSADYQYCCALVSNDVVIGTGAILKCKNSDPGFNICNMVSSDKNGEWYTFYDQSCYKCWVDNSACRSAKVDNSKCEGT